MKKKELMKRLSALAMSAMMTVTMIPSNAFAADIEFSDGGQEAIEVQADEEDNAEISIQDEDTDNAEDLMGEDLSVEDSEDASVDTEVFEAEGDADSFSAENGDIAAFADETTGTDDAKAAAAQWLKDNYLTNQNNKLITNGGTGVAKSADGLTYTIGLKTNGTGSNITSIAFRTFTSPYKNGWYIDNEEAGKWLNLNTKTAAKRGSTPIIKRPTAEEGPMSIKATLRLFSADTSDSVINNEAQAATAALAEQEFTITIEAAEPAYTMTVKVQDENGTPINDATVTLEKGWNTVSLKANGSYDMEKGANYTLTVKKDGYNDYKESSFTFNPTDLNTVKTVTLKKIITRNVRFNVTDKSGNPVNGATVTVKKGWYDTIKPEADGSYNLIDGTTYKYSVEAPNYKSVSNQEFTPDKDDTINVQLEKNISNYTVTINPVDKDNKAVENASIKVTYEEEDPWDEDETGTVELKANDNGTYTMQKGVTYTYTVTAPDYNDVKNTYAPSGDDENISLNVKMVSSINPADVETVNAIKAKFDAEMGALRPKFATDKNICEFVKTRIGAYTDIDTTGVTVSVKYSGDTDWVGTDGIIHYRAQAPSTGSNVKNVSLIYVFEKNGAKAETKERTATIGWDCEYFNRQMQADKDGLTWAKIKGSNTDAAEVTSNLTLPQCMGTSARTTWSSIAWESSNESVISFKDTGWGSLIDAKEGVIKPQPEDTEVTLTATFNANDTLLNSYVEKVSDFATLTKEFKVTVKGTGQTGPTEEELQAILNKYYTADQIKNFNDQSQVADLKNCTYDLQLPRYTKIKDDNNKYVFANKEITVTSDNENVIKVNGYRAAVDRFASNEDLAVNLIVTFTRDNVTVSKKIPVTVKAITEAEVQAQLDLMEYAKAHYFDGINDGLYADKDSITGNLHAFQELTAGEKWIYDNADRTGTGIIPDDFPEYDPMASSYRLFKSSNNAVVQHENLVVTRRETDTQITISSVLSSELYKDAAAKHPENTVLQKLYKQPVSVTVTIKGTRPATEGLQKLINEAQTLLDGMTEGTEAGQYPEGTKSTLQAAIATAKDVLNKENLTEKEVSDATLALQAAIDAAKDAQNAAVATVTVRVNMAGEAAQLRTFDVTSKDAAAYGYEKPEAMKNQVTVADALYVLHKTMYGDAFDENPSKYLNVGSNGWIYAMLENTTGNFGYYVNNKYPVDENGQGTVANTTALKNGDTLSLYVLADTSGYTDEYIYFENVPEEICAGKEFAVTVKGLSMMTPVENEKECTVELKNLDTAETSEFVTNDEGIANVKADKAGKYQLTVTKTSHKYIVAPLAELTAKEHTFDEGKVTKKPTCKEAGEKTYTCTVCKTTKTESIAKTNDHKYTWKTTAKATVFAPAKQQGTCSVCGKKVTRNYGKKLTATVKLNATGIRLQYKHSTNKIKVTMANGDSVKSWTSSNKRIITVNNKGVITAGTTSGTAKVTVTLKSGKKASLVVKVQPTKVITTKIFGLRSSETLRVGQKLALKPVLGPVTSQDGITYTFSNRDVAVVNRNGVITARKKGTAKITVRSGRESFVITVTVK